VFEVVLQALAERYFPAFDRLHESFLMKRLERRDRTDALGVPSRSGDP
jgi:hypothetical protein